MLNAATSRFVCTRSVSSGHQMEAESQATVAVTTMIVSTSGVFKTLAVAVSLGTSVKQMPTVWTMLAFETLVVAEPRAMLVKKILILQAITVTMMGRAFQMLDRTAAMSATGDGSTQSCEMSPSGFPYAFLMAQLSHLSSFELSRFCCSNRP